MKTLKVREMILKSGRPKIVVPVVGTTPEEIVAECREIKDNLPCDIIEWRADYYLSSVENLGVQLQEKSLYLEMLKILDDMNYIASGKPIMFTVRRTGQGGMVDMNKAQNDSIRELAAQSELVDLVDVELFDENDTFDEAHIRGQIDVIHKYGCKAVLSYHDFHSMLKSSEIVNLVKTMSTLGADLYKVAAMAENKEEAEEMLRTSAFLTKNDIGPLVMIAMGEHGTAARVACGKYGSCMTFASGSKASAPGQVDAHTMKKWLDDYYGVE